MTPENARRPVCPGCAVKASCDVHHAIPIAQRASRGDASVAGMGPLQLRLWRGKSAASPGTLILATASSRASHRSPAGSAANAVVLC